MAQLVFTEGPYSGQKLKLPETGILMGRKEDADLVLDDLQVSGHHARIKIQDGAWYIFDLQSSNGTTVNGHMIEAVKLNDGDVVGVGDNRFIFEADTAPAEALASITDSGISFGP